jgi:outer membrane lipoprotein carrier protein
MRKRMTELGRVIRRETRGVPAGAALVVALVVILLGRAASPDPDPPKPSCGVDVAKRVQKRYDGIRTLTADFTQRTREVSLGNNSLASPEEARGKVMFRKPGRMRWSYETPSESLLVSDGSVLWLYDPLAKEASRYPVSQSQLTGAALQFLMGEGKLLDTFDVEALNCGSSDKPAELRLTPREPTSYQRMEIRAHPESGEVLETSIIDLFGNQTTVVFSNVKANPDVPDSQFEFVPPDGVAVIDLLSPG